MIFNLETQEYIQLNVLLKLLGYVETGGEAKLRIRNEEVMVNNETCTVVRKKLVAGDIVLFNNESIEVKK